MNFQRTIALMGLSISHITQKDVVRVGLWVLWPSYVLVGRNLRYFTIKEHLALAAIPISFYCFFH